MTVLSFLLAEYNVQNQIRHLFLQCKNKQQIYSPSKKTTSTRKLDYPTTVILNIYLSEYDNIDYINYITNQKSKHKDGISI